MTDADWTTINVAPLAPGIFVDSGSDLETKEPRPVVCLLHQSKGTDSRVVLGVLDAYAGVVDPIADVHRITWHPNWGPGPA
ncbi:hypothetical protein [Mycobacterium sp. D16R24]|uniref:hypothetical protein n=1 Tax=Mycobacterium sp. D16R24 TaxID=1855656 RepID=UPI0011172A90|nr:hypothetical protein [Mycobacterium sp. D16R24]